MTDLRQCRLAVKLQFLLKILLKVIRKPMYQKWKMQVYVKKLKAGTDILFINSMPPVLRQGGFNYNACKFSGMVLYKITYHIHYESQEKFILNIKLIANYSYQLFNRRSISFFGMMTQLWPLALPEALPLGNPTVGNAATAFFAVDGRQKIFILSLIIQCFDIKGA
jgi:hypothetical protein